jgi:hypothetical protein
VLIHILLLLPHHPILNCTMIHHHHQTDTRTMLHMKIQEKDSNNMAVDIHKKRSKAELLHNRKAYTHNRLLMLQRRVRIRLRSIKTKGK